MERTYLGVEVEKRHVNDVDDDDDEEEDVDDNDGDDGVRKGRWEEEDERRKEDAGRREADTRKNAITPLLLRSFWSWIFLLIFLI